MSFCAGIVILYSESEIFSSIAPATPRPSNCGISVYTWNVPASPFTVNVTTMSCVPSNVVELAVALIVGAVAFVETSSLTVVSASGAVASGATSSGTIASGAVCSACSTSGAVASGATSSGTIASASVVSASGTVASGVVASASVVSA